ncbi:hypothetical protein [Streptomyces gilvosporeus]|uniref:DNA-binding protein n=1 Tax=Streptomyces gilvosporeus TaxID=553510 RepID=A0A1V0TKP6_9ACTN|nr:hypothetical protein [Streptomyces gilvosporeus]ARF53504.1 hypothetical protein B1H19_04360 [Streptomyces gilvosporeus]
MVLGLDEHWRERLARGQRSGGFRVLGRHVALPISEDGRQIEARISFIVPGRLSPSIYREQGLDLGPLIWVDARGDRLRESEVSAFARSEGQRLARLLIAHTSPAAERLGKPEFFVFPEIWRAGHGPNVPGHVLGAERLGRPAEAGLDRGLSEDFLRQVTDGGAPVADIRSTARTLAGSRLPTQAFFRFRDALVRRVDAGHLPYAGMIPDVRKLATAAGLDAGEETAELLRRTLPFAVYALSYGPYTQGVPDGFWKDCLKGKALELLAQHAPAVAQVLAAHTMLYGDRDVWWQILERTGTLSALTETENPILPVGMPARWLSACLQHWSNAFPTELPELIHRMAARLVADAVPVEPGTSSGKWSTMSLDVIDHLLSLHIPVADPSPRLGERSYDRLVVGGRDLSAFFADPRFHREFRAWLADRLSTSHGLMDSREGRGSLPDVLDHPRGLAVLAEWFMARATEAESGTLQRLSELLGRLRPVRAAAARPLCIGAARRIALIDTAGKLADALRGRMPEGGAALDTAAVATLLDGTDPSHTDADTRRRIAEALPELPAAALDGAVRDVLLASSCRLAQRKLAEIAGAEPSPPEAPKPVVVGPFTRLAAQLTALVDRKPWGGDWGRPTATLSGFLYGLPQQVQHPHRLPGLLLHAAAPGIDSRRHTILADAVHDYAAGPYTDPTGRWRITYATLPHETPNPWLTGGFAVRTESSVAVFLETPYRGASRPVLEYAPDGRFPVDGPMAAGGAEHRAERFPPPLRDHAWLERFVALLRERGAPPARPELAVAFAERTGLTRCEAAKLLTGRPVTDLSYGSVGGWPRYWKSFDEGELAAWDLGKGSVVGDDLLAGLSEKHRTTLFERLLPDDPERLWTHGPDVERGALWWEGTFGRLPHVPEDLLYRADEEFIAPDTTVAPVRQERPGATKHPYRPRVGPAVLARTVARGTDLLTDDLSGLLAAPVPTAAARMAAWLAYRTPAGHPLRPAIGAACARMHAAVCEGESRKVPVEVFAVPRSYSLELINLKGLEGVSVEADPLGHSLDRVHVRPGALLTAEGRYGPASGVLDALDDYLDLPERARWYPGPGGLPAVVDLRMLLAGGFAALAEHLAADAARTAGWEQDPRRSVPDLVAEAAGELQLSEDAAALYLMLAALPDPTDKNVREWTGWKPPRLKALQDALPGAAGLVVRAKRARAGRSLFLPGAWVALKKPRLPLEAIKLPLLPAAAEGRSAAHAAVVPHVPVPQLFTQAWQRFRPGAH